MKDKQIPNILQITKIHQYILILFEFCVFFPSIRT